MRVNVYVAWAAICLLALTSCKRESRQLRPSPSRVAVYRDAARESDLQPGGTQSAHLVSNPFDGNANAIAEGARLFGWYNCVGCHAHGGGAIGPPLIKTEWVYGGESANLFDTIVKGRPNGMPAWGGRIPEYQIWQIVAYIGSLNGKQPTSASASRTDSVEPHLKTLENKTAGVTK